MKQIAPILLRSCFDFASMLLRFCIFFPKQSVAEEGFLLIFPQTKRSGGGVLTYFLPNKASYLSSNIIALAAPDFGD